MITNNNRQTITLMNYLVCNRPLSTPFLFRTSGDSHSQAGSTSLQAILRSSSHPALVSGTDISAEDEEEHIAAQTFAFCLAAPLRFCLPGAGCRAAEEVDKDVEDPVSAWPPPSSILKKNLATYSPLPSFFQWISEQIRCQDQELLLSTYSPENSPFFIITSN